MSTHPRAPHLSQTEWAWICTRSHSPRSSSSPGACSSASPTSCPTPISSSGKPRSSPLVPSLPDLPTLTLLRFPSPPAACSLAPHIVPMCPDTHPIPPSHDMPAAQRRDVRRPRRTLHPRAAVLPRRLAHQAQRRKETVRPSALPARVRARACLLTLNASVFVCLPACLATLFCFVCARGIDTTRCWASFSAVDMTTLTAPAGSTSLNKVRASRCMHRLSSLLSWRVIVLLFVATMLLLLRALLIPASIYFANVRHLRVRRTRAHPFRQFPTTRRYRRSTTSRPRTRSP